MPLLFLIALFGAPYLEFLVFAEVANEIGGFSAIMLTLVTAIIGIYIIRQEGLQVLHNLKNTVQRGESPVSEIIHGFFLVVAHCHSPIRLYFAPSVVLGGGAGRLW